MDMNILFVHQGFPGQYLHICRKLAKQGSHTLVALAMQKPKVALPRGLRLYLYGIQRGNGQDTHPLARDTESKVIRAEACARAAEQLKHQGFRPDIICGHPGWGELLFLRHIWPETPILMYQEFFYQARGFDYDFDAELQGSLSWQKCARADMKNANTLLNLEAATWNITPTSFQRSSFPTHFQNEISIIHDGIDPAAATKSQNLQAELTLKDGHTLKHGEQIVTFVNRTIEPYRGCHSMIRAIPALQKQNPDAHIVIVGAETGVSYGAQCPNGEWKDFFLKEIEGKYDPRKVHFTGMVDYQMFLSLLRISQAHIYLTYPFVLSWSLLEAMSAGCAVVGSATAPVMEVIKNECNGLLVNFFDHQAIADQVSLLLKDRKLAGSLGAQARQDAIEKYSLKLCLPKQLELIDKVARKEVKKQPLLP